MKISWNWTEEDKRDFPQVKSLRDDFEVDVSSCENLEDLVWRISTEIYRLYGIVVPSERSVAAHVKNWTQWKELFNVA